MIDSLTITSILVFVSLLFISIAFHETMHALVAYKLGDDLAHSRGRISFNPLHHIDPVLTIALPAVMLMLGLSPILAAKPVPINPNRLSGSELGLAAVGLAGPLSNLVLAVIATLFLNGLNLQAGIGFEIIELFIKLNVSLFVFNMLPIPPLDGSRLLYAIAPRSVQNFMDSLESMGFFVSLMILMLLLPVLSPVLSSANSIILTWLLG